MFVDISHLLFLNLLKNMMDYMLYPKITIAGDLGSGKSTVSKLIADEKKFNIYSTGDIQRNIAAKHNMSTLELNEYMKTHPEIDDEIDNYTKELNTAKESFILDSRMAWFFIPDSFKLYLRVQSRIAANRVYQDQIRVSEKYKDIDAAEKLILKRKQIENERFKKLYNVNCNDLDNYDFVIDTSYAAPEELSRVIINQFERWCEKLHFDKFWVNPMTLRPTQDVVSLGRDDAKKIYKNIKRSGLKDFEPVLVLNSINGLYIYDGHKRTSAAIMNNQNLIPIKIIASGLDEIIQGVSVEDYVKVESMDKYVNSWESCHNFLFNEHQSGFSI